jgi:hypothetical protein
MSGRPIKRSVPDTRDETIRTQTMNRVAWVACIVWVVGCGGSSPTTPSSPSVPDYQGQWNGDFTVSSCTGTGIFAGPPAFCNAFQSGTVLAMRLTLSVVGTQVSGTGTFGGVSIPVSGVIGNDGRLLLSGSGGVVVQNLNATLTLTNWSTTASGTSMTGSWTTTWATAQGSGSATTSQTIRTLTKTG